MVLHLIIYNNSKKVRFIYSSLHFIYIFKLGQKAYIYVRKSNFHLPDDTTKPVIMVGPGTGLAPFVGFLQQRRALQKKGKRLGPAHLYFGCRRREEDFIYEKDQKLALEEGAITKLELAFSREKETKDYVQHHLTKNGEEVWNMLKSGGCFYVCGDAKYMAKDVEKALLEIIQKHGNKSKNEADEYLQMLMNNNRYLRDVWSPS